MEGRLVIWWVNQRLDNLVELVERARPAVNDE